MIEEYYSNKQGVLGLIKIRKEWNKFIYAHVQNLLAEYEWESNNKNKAIQHWLNVDEPSLSSYKRSQLFLIDKGVPYYLNNREYREAKKILDNINLPALQYDASIYKKIIGFNLRSNLAKEMLDLYNAVENIKNSLQIKNKSNNYCHKFAHYTRSSTAKKMLGIGEKKLGTLQLSVADLMNDPTEGKILYITLGEPEWLMHRFNHRNYQAYASCFSFNHDSLNQFRLYGKEEGKEATGVSLVFDITMFSDKKYSENIRSSFDMEINTENRIDDPSNARTEKNDDEPMKLPLYRCIYYDPKGKYYKLAHRAEITFHREGIIDGKDIEDIQEEWDSYSQKFIDEERKLNTSFEIVKNIF